MTAYVWNLVWWLSEPKDQEILDQGNLRETEREAWVKEYKPIAKYLPLCVSEYLFLYGGKERSEIYEHLSLKPG